MTSKKNSNKWRGSNRASRLPSNWTALRRAVLKRDNNSCQIQEPGCLGRATEVDHIQAGDDHRLSNLQAACRACHAAKSGREGNAAKARLRAARFRKKPTHPGRLKKETGRDG